MRLFTNSSQARGFLFPGALLTLLAFIQGCSSTGAARTDVASQSANSPENMVPAVVRETYDSALEAMRSDDTTEAELTLETIVLEYPEYAGPYVNLAILYLQDGRESEAREALDKALTIDPQHPAANNQLGIQFRKQGRFTEAEAAYRRALQTDPNYALAHFNLGVLLDVYLYRQQEALQHYEAYQALLAEPDTKVARWIIDLRRRLDASNRQARVVEEGLK